MKTELRIAFNEILKTEKELKQHGNSDTKYFKIQDLLNEQLRGFLRLDFTELPKSKFLKLCDLVSGHRPVQPFQFLIAISMRKTGFKVKSK